MEIWVDADYSRDYWLEMRFGVYGATFGIRDLSSNLVKLVVAARQFENVAVSIELPCGPINEHKDQVLVLIAKMNDVVWILEKLQIDFLLVKVSMSDAGASAPNLEPVWTQKSKLGGANTYAYEPILFPMTRLKAVPGVVISTPVTNQTSGRTANILRQRQLAHVQKFTDSLKKNIKAASVEATFVRGSQSVGFESDNVWRLSNQQRRLGNELDDCPGDGADMLRLHRFSYHDSHHHRRLRMKHGHGRCESGAGSPLRCLCPTSTWVKRLQDHCRRRRVYKAYRAPLHAHSRKTKAGQSNQPRPDPWFERFPEGFRSFDTPGDLAIRWGESDAADLPDSKGEEGS